MSDFRPLLYFAGAPLDRAAQLRADEAVMDDLRARDDAAYLALWRGKVLIEAGGPPMLAWLGAPAAEVILDSGLEGAVFLGLEPELGPRFALDVSTLNETEAKELAEEGRAFVDLRSLGLQGLDRSEAAIAAQAKSLLDWHARHRHCAQCGAPTEMREAGYRRACASCQASHFPRTDPVAIVHITHGDKCLLGRSKLLPEGVYSAIAGFVEPGETVEEAAAREALEETNIVVENVRYRFSQPWPWPSSLMLACSADALSEKITLRDNELEDARWFDRDTVKAALAGDHSRGLIPPPPLAVASQLMAAWLAETE